jgi:hypothetical protein
MGEEIEMTMQQAAHPTLHSIVNITTLSTLDQ